jgi:hypothetical protein
MTNQILKNFNPTPEIEFDNSAQKIDLMKPP